jgi:DNA-binding MarR family transcriptional regulator
MSIRIMSKVFDLKIPTGPKFVLMALADRADDSGSCFPSQKELAAKTSHTIRSVQIHLQWLEKNGLIKRHERRRKDGYRTSDEYRITLHENTSREKSSPEIISPENNDNSQAKNLRGNITSYEVIEPPVEPPTRAREVFGLPDWIPKQAWEDFCIHRGKDFTNRAKALAIGKLDRWRLNGHDPAEILNNSVMNGWTGIFEPKGKGNGTYFNGSKPSKSERAKAAGDRALAKLGIFDSQGENPDQGDGQPMLRQLEYLRQGTGTT